MCCVAQLVDGRVKNVSAAAAGELLADGFVLLDVRPPQEISKVRTLLLLWHKAGSDRRSYLSCISPDNFNVKKDGGCACELTLNYMR